MPTQETFVIVRAGLAGAKAAESVEVAKPMPSVEALTTWVSEGGSL